MDDDMLWISLLEPYFTNFKLLTDAETKRAKVHLKREMIEFASYATAETRGQHEAERERTLDEEYDWSLKHYLRASSAAQVDEKELPSSIGWWRDNAKTFPHIAPLARKWLGCIATSVPSERSFSTAGNTITKRRSALGAETVRDIIFMAENMMS
ncbi:hypothetical protein PR001_g20932 [Phytophthora rubi]|uniref:HAT C-terminal dimerisation domain-containing protein n=1 Tax=Phytophthora rubi TaxID=129364 RepID=A0A6A3JL90_9STRA|nr:hypothetical protein PR001_g20932 [Phytophthora rubi]